MRITRDYVFDMIEMVGRAVTTSRKRPAGREWLEAIGMLFGSDFPQKDEWGLFKDSPWQEGDLGFSSVEAKKAEAIKREVGDAISCRLWKIQRMLSFREIGTRDALKELQELCGDIAKKWISPGWGDRIRSIIDGDGR